MSSINVFGVDCADLDCETAILGAATTITSKCLESDLSQIGGIILWHDAVAPNPSNWGMSMIEGDFAIDNENADDTKQKRFPIVGSSAKPEYTKQTTFGFKQVTTLKKRTITFKLYHVDSVTYDYLRKLECGKVRPNVLFETEGGYILGKDGGIQYDEFELDPIWEEGDSAIEYWEGTLTFNSKNAPDRVPNPLPAF